MYLCEFIFSSLFVCSNFWQQFLYVRHQFFWDMTLCHWATSYNNSEEECLDLQGCRGHCLILYSYSRLLWPKGDRRKFYCFYDESKTKCWLVECIMGFCKALMGRFMAWMVGGRFFMSNWRGILKSHYINEIMHSYNIHVFYCFWHGSTFQNLSLHNSVIYIYILHMFLNIRYSKNKHLTIIYFVELSVHSAITLLPLYTMKTQKDCSLLGTRRSQLYLLSF